MKSHDSGDSDPTGRGNTSRNTCTLRRLSAGDSANPLRSDFLSRLALTVFVVQGPFETPVSFGPIDRFLELSYAVDVVDC